MKLEVRNIGVSSLVGSSLPLVIFVLALLGGAVSYLVIPNPQLSTLSAAQRVLSVGLYGLLYVVIATALLVFTAFVYNVLTEVLGLHGIVLDIEEIHQD